MKVDPNATHGAAMSLLRNVKWGVRWGLTVAAGLTVIAVIASIAAAFDPAPKDPSFISLVGFYFLAGISGGLLLGLLRPITKYKAGAVFIGILLAAVSMGLLDFLYVAKDHWTLVDTVLVALSALVGGPFATLLIWSGRARLGLDTSDPPQAKD